MTAIFPITKAETRPVAGEWRPHLLALVGAATAILLLFNQAAAHIFSIWWNSSTFNHCLLIPPIIAWLVSQRRMELSALQPRVWMPGLLLVGAGAFGWLLGEAGGVALARHAGLVFMLQGAVVACLGKAVSRGLAFPLFYALFLIPAGEEIVPILQTVTAEICMVLLGWVGIPAHIEGVFISIPNGYFEVAEACAGVKFLIAMVAYGALVANVCFRSWKRRAAFMLAATIIPILANGLRAFGTIYIASISNSDFAAGLDHVIYGGIFFAIVITLIMAAGWPFFDRGAGTPWFNPGELQEPALAPDQPSRLYRMLGLILAVAALPLLWSVAIAAASDEPPADIVLPQVAGWQRVPGTSGRPWEPHFAGADVIRMGRYRNDAGQEADLAIAVFARQEEGRELVAHGQGAVAPEGNWAWTSAEAAPPGGRSERIASYGTVREVLTFYRVGSILTGSGVAVKLETLKTRLFGGPQRAVAVMVSAEAPGSGISPRPAINAFLADLGSIAPLADAAAAGE